MDTDPNLKALCKLCQAQAPFLGWQVIKGFLCLNTSFGKILYRKPTPLRECAAMRWKTSTHHCPVRPGILCFARIWEKAERTRLHFKNICENSQSKTKLMVQKKNSSTNLPWWDKHHSNTAGRWVGAGPARSKPSLWVKTVGPEGPEPNTRRVRAVQAHTVSSLRFRLHTCSKSDCWKGTSPLPPIHQQINWCRFNSWNARAKGTAVVLQADLLYDNTSSN